MSCINDMKLLLDMFEEHVPDHDSNRLIAMFLRDKSRWYKAHGLFTTIRQRNLKAIKTGNKAKECQYNFEEVCAKTIFNLTRPQAPFDPDSPYWIIKNALALSERLGLPSDHVVQIVTPTKREV